MPLQVWLPLNSDTKNIGSSGFIFSNTNTSCIAVSNGGKVTSNCYNFNSTVNNNGIYSADSGFMSKYINNHSWTLCAWVNTTSTQTTVMTLSYGLRFAVGAANNGYVNLYNSSRMVYCYSSVAVNDGKWHHISASYDVTSNKITYYVDGVVTGTADYTSGYAYSSSWTNGLYIGRDCNNNVINDFYFYKGKLNDVRIYDHCLSQKEVKELAKGLMLHYTLSRSNNNRLVNSDFRNGKANWTSDASTSSVITDSVYGTVLQVKATTANTGRVYNSVTGMFVSGETYTYSFLAKADSPVTVIPSRAAVDNGTTVTLTNVWTRYSGKITATASSDAFSLYIGNTTSTIQFAYVKLEKGNKYTGWIPNMLDVMSKRFPINSVSPSGYVNQMTTYTWGPSASQWNFITLTPNGGGNYQPRTHRVRFKVTVLAGSFSSVTVLFYNLSTGTGNTRVDAPIINGYVDIFITPTAAVPNLLIYAGVAGATANNQIRIEDLLVYDQFNVSDNSGYGNNGSAVNITDVSPDTPRYQASYQFSSTSMYIRLPVKTFTDTANTYTFSWWSKYSTYSSNMFWGFADGNRLNLYMANGLFYWNTGDGAGNPIYSSGTTVLPSSTYADGNWHHFAVTGNGSSTLLYIDGVKVGTAKTYKGITGTQIYISGWDTSTSYKLNGSMSDFRIYATALSADDILELYHTAASIDKNGNMHCYELVEV